MTKVMIVDGGARGHVLAAAYYDDFPDGVIVAPGNEGIKSDFVNRGGCDDISVEPSVSLKDPETILRAARKHKPDLVDVAQDDAIALGAVDLLQKEGFTAFGPSRKAAQIEWDKAWAREFMRGHGIPSPEFRVFSRDDLAALDYANNLADKKGIVFFKAAGLYAGKGVVSATKDTILDALSAIKGMGEASKTYLVEEGLRGEEFSYYAMVDGENFICFKSAQDNKRVFNGDKGPNTGGMGANAPALITKGLESRIESEIIAPAVKGLAEEGRPYKGILYLGGMLCEDGSLKVIEFNSRWGDPEAQAIIPGICNYVELVEYALAGRLRGVKTFEDDQSRVCIVGASVGYPLDYSAVKGKRIFVDLDDLVDICVYSAGIKVVNEEMYANGGRLFSVVGVEDNVLKAKISALQGMAFFSIEDDGLHYRTDIAWRDVDRFLKGQNS